jgi:hypothetical protein
MHSSSYMKISLGSLSGQHSRHKARASLRHTKTSDYQKRVCQNIRQLQVATTTHPEGLDGDCEGEGDHGQAAIDGLRFLVSPQKDGKL